MRRILELLGFRNLVRLRGRSFHNLTDDEVALMIEAHMVGGNEAFEQAALSEFILVPNKNRHLEEIRRRIIRIDEGSRTPQELDGLRTAEGLRDLSDLVNQLRNQH